MIEFRMLGALALQGPDGREPQAVLTHPKRLALLAYLAIATPRGFHRRDTLLALLWPDLGQDRARAALRKTVHHIRRALGEAVLVGRGDEELAVAAGELWCDAAALDAQLGAGQLADAVELYRGDLLAGFYLPDAPEFERWLEQERARMRRAVFEAVRRLADQEEARGDRFAAVQWARHATALQPDDETALRRLLTLLRAIGDRAGAIRAYEDFARHLASDYEVEPSAETQRLVLAIRADAAPSAAPPPRVAREEHLARAPAVGSATAVAEERIVEAPPTSVQPTPAAQVPAAKRPAGVGRRVPLTVFAIAAVVVVLVVAGAWRAMRRPGSATALSASGVAVFPFSYRGGSEYAYLGSGIASLLGTNLDGNDLHSADPYALQSLLPRGKAAPPDPGRARELAASFGAGLYILGDIIEAGGRVRVSATLYDARRRTEAVARVVEEGSAAELFRIVDRLAAGLLAGRPGAPGGELSRLAARTTHSLPALKAYLEGERQFRSGHYKPAVDAFTRAVAEDSTFALAHYRLASAYSWSADPAASGAAANAVRFAHRLSPPDRALVEALVPFLDGDANEAERRYRAILSTAPHEGEAWYLLGEVLFHYNPARGRPIVEARPLFERALALGPSDGPLTHLLEITAIERDYAAFDTLLRAMEPDAHFGPVGAAVHALRTGVDTARVLAATRRLPDTELVNLARHMFFLVEDRRAADRVLEMLAEPTRPVDVRATGFLLRAHLEVSAGRWRAAERELAAAAALDPVRALEHGALLQALPFLPVPAERLRQTRDELARWAPAAAAERSLASGGMAEFHAHFRSYLLGLVHARLGDDAAALRSAEELERLGGPPEARTLAADLARGVRARVAFQRGAAARTDSLLRLNRAERAGAALMAVIPFYLQLHERFLRAEALSALGRSEEALGWHDSFREHSSYPRMYLAPLHLARAELLDRLGRPREAAAHYARFAALWKDCDPELRPLVERALGRVSAIRD